MAVLKNKTQGLYVNISKDILMDHSLSLRDRGMLATIMSLPDSWDFNVKGFTKILPDGVECVRSSVNELTRRGYLPGGQERSEGGRFGKNVIEVHQNPYSPQLENPITDNPFTGKTIPDNSHTDVPRTENQRQVINNKVTNNKAIKNQEINHQSINHRNEWQMEELDSEMNQLIPILQSWGRQVANDGNQDRE